MDQKNKHKSVEITEYTDYVDYIDDLVKHKREVSGFSFRVFCRKSGFRSPNYLKWVIEKVRPISLKSVHKFIAGLSLDKREGQYFTLMVNYKEATDPQTKRFYYEQMLAWQQRHVGAMTKDAYEYLSHWYYLAIRELVGSKNFKNDPSWIRDRLDGELTLWDIKNSLDTLERLNLIKKDAQGKWQQTAKDLHTEKEVMSLAAFSYHTEMLDLARLALSKRSADERYFQSLVSMVNKKTFKGLKSKIEKFQQELIEYLQSEEIENAGLKQGELQELYALNIQMLPLTVRQKGDV